ncbi:hypothetical protein BJ742DRAFT_808128 [Cladochytrium replicatum]|nr:hypothetical protein BJ742DRAFT_808128 [Cladochytrium replicatum]
MRTSIATGFLLLCSISSVFGACEIGTYPCGNGCMPSSSVCCDAQNYYCGYGETCATSNGTVVCVQPCLPGGQGSQECGGGCISIGGACCGSNAARFYTCNLGGKCDTTNTGCLAFGTNTQEPGVNINPKVTIAAKPVTNVQSTSQSSSGSSSSATSPASSNGSGSSNNQNSNNMKEGDSTVGTILIVVVAIVDTLLALFVGFKCLGYKSRVSRIEKILPKPIMDRQTFSTNVPMYPPAAALNLSNTYIP